MKLTGLFAAAVALAVAAPAFAQTTTAPKAGAKMSQAECTSAWTKLDASKSGNVTQTQATGVVTDFKTADTNKDGKLSQTEFMSACNKGLVTASTASGAGSRGMTGSEPTKK
ncbi:MAG TPA: hypothetical protein VG900_17450 [Hyphomicrobiaceae bacterium]|jgi:hypothetical protein|nr:hypothetical protein [Hyphomicrobiaceae bacterium]